MDALQDLLRNDPEVRKAVLEYPDYLSARPERLYLSWYGIAANLLCALTALSFLAQALWLRPIADFSDVGLHPWALGMLDLSHVVLPIAFPILAMACVWNAAVAFAARRHRQVMRRLLRALGSDVENEIERFGRMRRVTSR